MGAPALPTAPAGSRRQAALGATGGRGHAHSLFCVKKKKHQKQKNKCLFSTFLYPCINYSVTVRRKTTANSWRVAIFVTFPCAAHACVAGDSKGACPPQVLGRLSPRWRAVYRIFLYPSSGFAVAPGQRAGGTHGVRRGPWLPGAPVVAVGLGVASGARGGWHGLRPQADPPLRPAVLACAARDARSRDLSTVLSEVPFLTAPSPGAAAVPTLVTSAFSQTLPRDCQRLLRAPGCCPPAGPGRPSS